MSPQEYLNKLKFDTPLRHSSRCRFGRKRSTKTPSRASGYLQLDSSSQQRCLDNKPACDKGLREVGDDPSSKKAVDDKAEPGRALVNNVNKTTTENLGGGSDRDMYFPRTMSCCSCCLNNCDHSETESMWSYSTNATMDNNIGAGRTLDNYVYQPVGRWLERVTANWFVRKGKGVDSISATSLIPGTF